MTHMLPLRSLQPTLTNSDNNIVRNAQVVKGMATMEFHRKKNESCEIINL